MSKKKYVSPEIKVLVPSGDSYVQEVTITISMNKQGCDVQITKK